jgi:tetratricopeptide (TPR) repeat protein
MAKPTNTRANEAFDLLKQGKHKEAKDILEEIVREDRADAAVLETLGDVREQLGDKLGALEAYSGAVTHLRTRGEHRRALGVIELMLIVDEASVSARREAADIKRELDDEAGCWREVTAGVVSALSVPDLLAAVSLCEEMADAVPDQAAAFTVCRRIKGSRLKNSRHEAARLARVFAEALRTKGKIDDARALSALATEIEPGLKDVIHARAVPVDERTEEPWAEKTPEVPAAGDDDPTDMDR